MNSGDDFILLDIRSEGEVARGMLPGAAHLPMHLIPMKLNELPKERQFVDDRDIISFTEFTIFETMHYDALYTILAGGGKWDGKDPWE